MESFWRGELSGLLWIVSGEFSRNYPCFPGEWREDRLSANVRRVQLSDPVNVGCMGRVGVPVRRQYSKKTVK